MTLPYPKIPLCVHCLDEAQRTDASRNLADKHGHPAWQCPHQTPYPDGEIYWDIRQNQERDTFDNVEELERQLTRPKRKNLRSILSGPTDFDLRSTRSKIKRALDRILELPGMRLDLRLGNWHKYWALRCDDHVLHHLNHIVRVWDTITSGVPDAKRYADVDTVKTLQLCIPEADASRIGLGMEQNQLFTGVRDMPARDRLLQNISSLGSVVIPSMETFHDNMSYLTIGLAALRELVRPIPKGRTLFQAFESSWRRPQGKSLQNSENELSSASIRAEQAYCQLLLLALRHFPFLSNERPLQKRGGKPISAGICQQYEEKLDKLARDVGFSLTRTVSRANSEPGQIPPGRGTSTWRGGKPSVQVFRHLREVSFLPILREALSQPAATPVFVMADFLRSFLGESVYDYGNGFNYDFDPGEIDLSMIDAPVGEDIEIRDVPPIRRLPPGGMYTNIRQSWDARRFQPDVPEDVQRGIRAGQKRSQPNSAFLTSIRVPSLSTSAIRATKRMRLDLPYEDVQRAGEQGDRREQQPGLEDPTTAGLPTARGYELEKARVRRQKHKAEHQPDARKRPARPPGGGLEDQKTHQRERVTPRPRTRQAGRKDQSSQRSDERLNLPKDIQRAGEWSSAPGKQIPQPTNGQAQRLLGSTQGAGARRASGKQEIQPINSGEEDGTDQPGSEDSEMVSGVSTNPVEKVPTPRALELEEARIRRQRLETNKLQHSADRQSQIGRLRNQRIGKRKQLSRPTDTEQQESAQVQRAGELASSSRRPRGQEGGTERTQPKQQAQDGQGLQLPFNDVRRAGVQGTEERAPMERKIRPNWGIANASTRRMDETEQEFRERKGKGKGNPYEGIVDSGSNTKKGSPGIASEIQKKKPETSKKVQKPPPKGQAAAPRRTMPRQPSTRTSTENILSSIIQKGLREEVSEPRPEREQDSFLEHITHQATVSTAQTEGRRPGTESDRDRQPEFLSFAQSVNEDISDMLSDNTSPGDFGTYRDAEELSSDDEAVPGKAGGSTARRPGSDGFDDLSRQLGDAWK